MVFQKKKIKKKKLEYVHGPNVHDLGQRIWLFKEEASLQNLNDVNILMSVHMAFIVALLVREIVSFILYFIYHIDETVSHGLILTHHNSFQLP